MHLVYCLNCTVCGKSFDGRSSWLRHLTEDEHLNEGRGRSKGSLSSWWGGGGGGGGGKDKKGMKECTIVIFCSFSLTDQSLSLSLLEKLSKAGGGVDDGGGGGQDILVTDFIWWPERDTVAYVQFESRYAVQKLWDGLEDPPNLQVGNKLVQLKKAEDFLKLEWKALLPEKYSEQLETTTPTAHAIRILNEDSSLQTQYTAILKSIQIPDSNFNYILQIVDLILEKLQSIHPSGQLVIFRSYHLRLKTMGTNTLLIFAYIADNPKDPQSYISLDKEAQNLIFNCPLLQNRFPDGPFHRKPFSVNFEEGTLYQNGGTSGFRFNFVTHPLTIVEAQLCRLLQYLCKFDPHVKPLLTLVHYWATSSKIHLSEKNIPVFDSQKSGPEPLALEWLVILFLTREGLIPSVREILERPHKILVVTDRRIDIGFSSDPKFPKEWRQSKGLPALPSSLQGQDDNFILREVVNLARNFFEFYSTNLGYADSWVVNPKDGEIFKRSREGHIGNNHLSKEEIQRLNWAQNSKVTPAHLLINNYRIFILHPLYISWKLSFDVETWTESTCQKMGETAKKLGEFLNEGKCEQNLAAILNGGCDAGAICSIDYSNPLYPVSCQIQNPVTPLQCQFNSVCKAIEVPEEEFNYARREIFKNVEQLFLKEYPTGRLIIYRNYYLRLRNTGTNTLLIYAFAGSPFDDTTFLTISTDFQLDLPQGFRKKRCRGDIDGKTYYEHAISKFRFHFVTFPLQIVEAHLSLMVQYLCQFDPKVKPLLTLVYFWARSQEIKIAEEEYPNYKYHSNCPEPVGLEWMVILFLAGEGVISKVREILERPHVPLVVSDNRHDVGFSMDKDYPNEWREKKGFLKIAGADAGVDVTSDLFIFEVVDLARRFFEFYANNLEEGDWVLNPKDGEILKRAGNRIGKSGLSKEEMERLAIVQSKETTPEHLIIGNFRIFMLHPLYITWKLSFDVGRWTEETCGRMRRMARDLGGWVEGRGKGQQRSLEEVLAGGKEKVKEVQLELSCEMNQNLRAAIRTKLEQRKRKMSAETEKDDNGKLKGVKKKLKR